MSCSHALLADERLEVVTIEGEIRGNLYDALFLALKNDSDSAQIAQEISLAFEDEFTNGSGLRVRASFSFDLIAYFDQDQFIKYGEVMKASLIVGKAISRKVIQQDPETGNWSLLPELVEDEDKPFYPPVKSSRISSLFQFNRRHPVTKRLQPHNGIDFVGPSGTPVFPALEGVIITMGRTRSKGKYILIEHDNGYLTTYDHLKKFQKGLSVGMRVELREQIGEVGRTGFATGAHLHFGVLRDGHYVNPLNLIKESRFNGPEEAFL